MTREERDYAKSRIEYLLKISTEYLSVGILALDAAMTHAIIKTTYRLRHGAVKQRRVTMQKEIVIKISEEDLDNIIIYKNYNPNLSKLMISVKNGTVLPEHGRLIDADSLIKQTTEQICKKCDRRRGIKDGKLTKRFVYEKGDAPCRACGIGDMHEYLDDAPTILEATGVINDVE